MPTFYEFFAGGGMARAGLGLEWNCVFANDNNASKLESYNANWKENLAPRDIVDLKAGDLTQPADLAWASFPCQDLSLAGNYKGLSGKRSSLFWTFWSLIQSVEPEAQPKIITLENVCGLLTSHEGKDFKSLISALRRGGYEYGGVVIDARFFVPHSRPRLFIIAVRNGVSIPANLTSCAPHLPFHTKGLVKAWRGLEDDEKASWHWWNLAVPQASGKRLEDIIDWAAPWDSRQETDRLLNLMLPAHRTKIERAKRSKTLCVGMLYKRTRLDESGRRAQRAEVRFDGLAGCLRTPGGGSSRQTVVLVHGHEVKSRLLRPREMARLMGVPESYKLPERANDACHLFGDGVAVPVVRHIAINLLAPLLKNRDRDRERRDSFDMKARSESLRWRQSLNSESAPSPS